MKRHFETDVNEFESIGTADKFEQTLENKKVAIGGKWQRERVLGRPKAAWKEIEDNETVWTDSADRFSRD